jgi:Tfp pilus assembly protein PilP
MMGNTICFIGIFFLFGGCDNPAELSGQINVHSQTTVVKKKIVQLPELDPPSDIKKEVTPVQNDKQPEIDDRYDPEGKIDPFVLPSFKVKPVVLKKKMGEKRIPLTPLEKLDFSQFKLAGIIRSPSGNRALVEETSGKGYAITKGTYIGTNSGRVVNILKDKIIVYEPLLPVEEVAENSIYEINGGKFINVEGEKFKVKIAKIDGKDYFIDSKELKLQKSPGKE